MATDDAGVRVVALLRRVAAGDVESRRALARLWALADAANLEQRQGVRGSSSAPAKEATSKPTT